ARVRLAACAGFLSQGYRHLRDPHSFPTRRSSDLVENSSSLEMLRALGCDGIQGNYLAKPMKQEELTSWLLALSHDKDLKDGPVRSEDTRLNSSHVKSSYAVFCVKKRRTDHSLQPL